MLWAARVVSPRVGGDHTVDELAHRGDLAAEHVRLADLAAVVDEQDALGHVLDVDKVEPELRERPHPELAGAGLVDDVADLRVVTRAVDAPRLDDDDRVALGYAVAGDLVRPVLRLVVVGEEA